jgi:ribosome biogenesis GTPase
LIHDYGWSDALQEHFDSYAARGFAPGRVIAQQRGLLRLATDAGELSAELSGRFIHEAAEGDHPVTGDWVAAALRPAEGTATVHHVLPRRTVFTRRAAGPAGGAQVVAANVDVALLTASLNADFNPRRLERYLASAWESGAAPVVVLTKADACDDSETYVAEVEPIAWGAPIHVVSAVTGAGMADLAARLEIGKTAVVLGSSGVGKSTLVNTLAGAALMATQAIREDDAHGRHTTTHRELVRLPSGALILDTPGMRELGLWDAEAGMSTAFGDVEALAAECRFNDCAHGREPGCAIRAALECGDLDPGRWRNYQKLQKELQYEADRADPHAAREAARRFHRPIAKANRARRKERARDW